MSALDIALGYIDLGLCPIPIPYREKGPTIEKWTELRLTPETAGQYFNGAPQNIGIILGEVSRHLVDVDIDCAEALAIAPFLLPDTPGRFGRASKRASHWLYLSQVPKHIKYEDPNIDGPGKTIVELRTGGVQTVFPGSVHVSGESIELEDNADLATIPQIDPAALKEAVGKVAAASLLARYFPRKGRHDFCLALGGGLLRDGWTVEEAEQFITIVAWVGGSDKPRERAATVRGTAEKVAAGEPVTGWKRVTELIGGVGKLVAKARKWLPRRAAPADATPPLDPLPRLETLVDFDAVAKALGDTVWLLAVLEAGEEVRLRATEVLTRYATRKDVDRAFAAAKKTGKEQAKKAAQARRATANAEKEDDATINIVVDFDELVVADQMIPALAALPNVFTRGWKLAEVIRERVEAAHDGIKREPNAPRIVEMPKARVRGLVSHTCAFAELRRREDGEEYLVPCATPDLPVQELCVRGVWPGIRRIMGITECPVLRPDGTVLDTPGYDQATGLIYEPNAEFPPIPPEPTLDDAKKGIAALWDIVQDFPFATLEHVSAWMALLLTPFAEPAIDDCVPLGVFDKNVNRAGGTKLADLIGSIYSGRPLARMIHTDEPEMRKRLLSLAMAADPIVLLDNVVGTLDSQVLAAALTSRTFQDRKLGVNEIVSMPLRVLWLVSAKNLTLSTELIGRTLHVRLESPLEHPDTRTGFRYPHLERHVTEQRPALATAALTILRAYFVAGCPDQGLPAWGSFEKWSAIIRGALVWAGCPDPYAGRAELVDAGDAEGNALESALVAWQAAFNGEAKLVSEVMSFIDFGNSELRGALAALCDCPPERLDAKTLGYALKTSKRRVAGGLRLNHRKRGPKGVPWFVERAGG